MAFLFSYGVSFYIYILWSDSSSIYYVGHTSNVSQRLIQHNESDKDTFTSKHRPWVLKVVFDCGESRAQAMKIETFIKRQKRKNFIEQLIQTDVFYGILAPLVRVPQLRD